MVPDRGRGVGSDGPPTGPAPRGTTKRLPPRSFGGDGTMNVLNRDSLKRLGAGETIAALCKDLGIARDEFGRRWKLTIARRCAKVSGQLTAAVGSRCEIQRDRWGIPHIFADNDRDLFFAFGFAMAQDRL